jgi:hypothetical protein
MDKYEYIDEVKFSINMKKNIEGYQKRNHLQHVIYHIKRLYACRHQQDGNSRNCIKALNSAMNFKNIVLLLVDIYLPIKKILS